MAPLAGIYPWSFFFHSQVLARASELASPTLSLPLQPSPIRPVPLNLGVSRQLEPYSIDFLALYHRRSIQGPLFESFSSGCSISLSLVRSGRTPFSILTKRRWTNIEPVSIFEGDKRRPSGSYPGAALRSLISSSIGDSALKDPNLRDHLTGR